VATHLNSGNLLFTAEEESAAAGERLEEELAERYGRPIQVMVRTPDELAAALERQPFRGDGYDERRLQIGFLSAQPAAGARDRLGDIAPEECVVDGREAFLHYPNGIGRSKLTATVLERGLGVRITVRGVRTVAGILERC
jgi:uncharacterized protein (DUF1697 family)